MRPGIGARVLRALGIASLIMASGVGMDASAADPGTDSAPPEPDPTTATTEQAPTADLPGQQTTTVQYGPYNIPAAPQNPDGTHGHAGTGNRFQLGAEKPCNNCYVTAIRPDLVYPDGTRAGRSTDTMLHHMVMFNSSWGRSDATCGGSFLGFLGERFFASGDERTPMPTVGPFGYHVGWMDSWTMIYDLMNSGLESQDVVIQLEFDWVPDTTPGMTAVDPVWLDIDQCGDSEVAIPAGPSSQTYTWTVNRPGRLLGVGGHIHDHGINLTVRNDSTGEQLCDSVAGYGESPLYIDHHGVEHLSSMSICQGTGEDPVGALQAGQQVTIQSNYDAPEPVEDAMGIAVAYIAP